MTFAIDAQEQAKILREKRLTIATQLLGQTIRVIGTSEIHGSTINACLKGAEELIKRNEERTTNFL